MAIDLTVSYFDDLVRRAKAASAVPRDPWIEAKPNECHSNCDEFVLRFSEYEVVRGWLVLGGHWFIPHSVVRQVSSGKMIDITPDPGESGSIPFVEHLGPADDFSTLRKGRDGGWYYMPEPS